MEEGVLCCGGGCFWRGNPEWQVRTLLCKGLAGGAREACSPGRLLRDGGPCGQAAAPATCACVYASAHVPAYVRVSVSTGWEEGLRGERAGGTKGKEGLWGSQDGVEVRPEGRGPWWAGLGWTQRGGGTD